MWECGAATNQGLVSNMVKANIILTEVVRDAFLAIDRQWFVPRNVISHCYEDRPLPIGYGVTISAPHMHAAMAELMVKSMLLPAVMAKHGISSGNMSGVNFYDLLFKSTSPTDRTALYNTLKGKRILDVGSGSGFLTAVMASIVGPTGVAHGIEHVPDLVAYSTNAIATHCKHIISSVDPSANGNAFRITVGDGRVDGFPQGFLDQYDAIHVGAAAHRRAPQALIDRIAPSGCLVIPIDDGLHVIHRSADGKQLTDTIEMGVRFVPLTDLSTQLQNQ